MASLEPQSFGHDEPPPRPTTPPVRKGFLLVLLVLCLAATLVYGVPYVAERAGYAWEAGRSRAAVEALARLGKAGAVDRSSALFRLATVAVSPAVVNIQTQRFRRENAVPGLPLGAGANRLDRSQASFGVGSGVIIDRDHGYVVTNNHVIQDADVITVRLSQGSEVSASVVGADPKTDLAVLRIKASVRVAAEWGDSDKLSSGDWVLAIGSPYMLDHTVTAGIVSATGRNNLSLPGMDESAYQDFVQTDAAINPGNSGGPLVDLNGKVVGINTAILTGSSFLRGEEGASLSGGFEGIGLAIPSSMARRVVEGLIKNGKVARGHLGVTIQPLTPAQAREFKVPDSRGAIVNGVQPGSPAAKAGLAVGDVVVAVGGKATPDPTTLRTRVAELAPDSEVSIDYYRQGERRTARVVVADQSAAQGEVPTSFGFRVREVPAVPGGEASPHLVVDQVVMGSPAARARMVPGLRISAVGRTEVHTREEFEKAAARFTPAEGLPLRVHDPAGNSAFLTVGGPPPLSR